ncbi:hypothetical protein ACQQ2N_05965 [Dokdonella sp. MW10]|uniref:hypothetical protein n=1 Tax=Dokdonella sp. MW10 TaxID=2992926 RepID=UPI003F7F0FDB
MSAWTKIATGPVKRRRCLHCAQGVGVAPWSATLVFVLGTIAFALGAFHTVAMIGSTTAWVFLAAFMSGGVLATVPVALAYAYLVPIVAHDGRNRPAADPPPQ